MIDRKTLFFDLLQKELNQEGFVYKKAKNQFVKKDEMGNEFIYEFNIWPQFKMIEAGFRILIKQVEDVKKKAWGKLYSKFESLGKEKPYLTKEPSEGHSWTNTEENVRLAVKKEIDFYHSSLKGYFSKHLDLKYLDKVLNTIPGEELYISHNAIFSCFLAIIVAKLVNNPDLDSLFPIYRAVVEKFNGNYLNEYDLLQKHLLHHDKLTR
ncbi:MAG TPA: hypothetical protein VGQ04_04840 [Chitinophagaceae bacterium]|jgi:hypothetical protein|nr:hypothetical protein [Chitinophagaceae bacterium]